MKTNCEWCSREIEDTDVQLCTECGMDGLCEDCIGQCDHDCSGEED